MHVKAVCFCAAGDAAGLYIDSGCESSLEEQIWRFEATHHVVTVLRNEVSTPSAGKDKMEQEEKRAAFLQS